MTRRLAFTGVGAAAALAAAAVTGSSGAAFVASTEAPQTATADTVERWLGLEAPAAETCQPGGDTTVHGADESLRVDVGGADVRSPRGRTIDCALVLHARDPLPEGAAGISVRVGAADPSTPGPLAAAAVVGRDGSAASDIVTLAPGERRAVRLTVRAPAGSATASLGVVVRAPGDTTDFLRYAVSVGACVGDAGASCEPPGAPGDAGAPGADAGTPGPAAPDTRGPVSTGDATEPSVPTPAAGAPTAVAGAGAAPRACISRRHFVVHLRRLPAGQYYAAARVRVDGHLVKVRRGTMWTAEADLRGRPKKTVHVVIEARTTRGRRVHDARTYRTCIPKRPAVEAG
jgi:hypothetical protein